MRIHVLSDLHLEYRPFDLLPEFQATEGADAVILAGDLAAGGATNRLKHVLRQATCYADARPVFYIAGNHEFYGTSYFDRIEQLGNVCAAIKGVRFLNDTTAKLGDYQVFGSTLWSSFALAGAGRDRDKAMGAAQFCISDFKAIRYGAYLMTPMDIAGFHAIAVDKLRSALATKEKTIVISHFVPSPLSIHPKFDGDSMNPYFCTDLGHLMGPQVPLWIHGHTHSRFDYVHPSGTRVVCNPRGYVSEGDYDPAKTVELP